MLLADGAAGPLLRRLGLRAGLGGRQRWMTANCGARVARTATRIRQIGPVRGTITSIRRQRDIRLEGFSRGYSIGSYLGRFGQGKRLPPNAKPTQQP